MIGREDQNMGGVPGAIIHAPVVAAFLPITDIHNSATSVVLPYVYGVTLKGTGLPSERNKE